MKNNIKELGFPSDVEESFQTKGLFIGLYYDVHIGLQPFSKGFWLQGMHVDEIIFNEYYALSLEKAQEKLIDLAVNYIVENKISKRTHEQAFRRVNK